jgi:hypothetical protein
VEEESRISQVFGIILYEERWIRLEFRIERKAGLSMGPRRLNKELAKNRELNWYAEKRDRIQKRNST